MLQRPEPGPLTETELDRIDQILKLHFGDDGLNVEAVDGIFAALVCSPKLVKPSEWMAILFGANRQWESEDEFQEILTLLMRHWNHVAARIDDGSYEPLLSIGTDAAGKDVVFPHVWCWGFGIGMHVHHDLWLDESEAVLQRLLAPITFIAADTLRATKKSKERLSRAEQDQYTEQIPITVVLLRQYWLKRYPDDAASEPATPETRSTPKIGRNDPCPCGSGKKYKFCHGAEGTH